MKKTKSEHSDDSSFKSEDEKRTETLPVQEIEQEEFQKGEDGKISEDPLTLKEKQIMDLSDKFMRLAAEYDNFRRRTQKEKDALYTDSIATVAAAWLPVVDNLERAVAVSSEYHHEEAQKIKAGIELIISQAGEAMNTLGVTEIEALGNPFDPNSMEAIMHVEDESVGESEVVEVFKKGYKRGDKVLRHAIVKVAN